MRDRLLRIGVLAAVLVAINLVGRLVVRVGAIDDVNTQQQVAVAAYGGIALAMAVTGWLWGRLRPLNPVIGELSAAAVAAVVVIVLVGPFVSGTTPASVGVGDSFEVVWQYAGFAGGGGLLGILLLITLGKDYRSRSLQRFAEEKLTKPHRPVRR